MSNYTDNEQRTHPKAVAALIILSLAWFLSYYEIILDLPNIYWDSIYNRYSIIALILSIVLAFSKRKELLATNFKTSQLGLLTLFFLNLICTYFVLEQNLILQQCCVVAMVPAMVLTVIGQEGTKVLTLPILLILFAIPFGQILSVYIPNTIIELLEKNWLIEDSNISFENGLITFEIHSVAVKKIIDYLLLTPTIVVVSLFISHFIFSATWLQLTLALLIVIIPTILTYVFLGLYVSSGFLPKAISVYNLQIITRGLMIIGIVLSILATKWLKFTTFKAPLTEKETKSYHSNFLELHWLRPIIIAYGIFFIIPWVGGIYQDIQEIRASKIIELIPPKLEGWDGPFKVDHSNWYPSFPYSRASFVRAYQKNTLRVQFFTAYVGREMEPHSLLHESNNVYIKKKWKVISSRYLTTNIKGYIGLNVKETLIEYAGRTKLIWHWYYIGNATEAKPSVVNILSSVSYISRSYQHSGIIAVATDYPGNLKFGRRNLTIFLNSLSPYMPLIINPTKKKLLDFTVR